MLGADKSARVKVAAFILLHRDSEDVTIELACFSDVAIDRTKTRDEQNLYDFHSLHGFSLCREPTID